MTKPEFEKALREYGKLYYRNELPEVGWGHPLESELQAKSDSIWENIIKQDSVLREKAKAFIEASRGNYNYEHCEYLYDQLAQEATNGEND